MQNKNSDHRVLLVAVATRAEAKALFRRVLPVEGEQGVFSLGKRGMELLETGIGPVNGAYRLGKYIGKHRSRLLGVLNLGVAGSFDLQKSAMLDTVIVAREIWPEVGLKLDDGIDPRGLGLCLGQSPQGAVWDRIELEPERNAPRMGISLPRDWSRVTGTTVAGVTGTPKGAERVVRSYPADVESMEGFALGWVCMQETVPFVQCRVISNLVGSREVWDLKGALRMLGQAGKTLLQGTEGLHGDKAT